MQTRNPARIRAFCNNNYTENGEQSIDQSVKFQFGFVWVQFTLIGSAHLYLRQTFPTLHLRAMTSPLRSIWGHTIVCQMSLNYHFKWIISRTIKVYRNAFATTRQFESYLVYNQFKAKHLVYYLYDGPIDPNVRIESSIVFILNSIKSAFAPFYNSYLLLRFCGCSRNAFPTNVFVAIPVKRSKKINHCSEIAKAYSMGCVHFHRLLLTTEYISFRHTIMEL